MDKKKLGLLLVIVGIFILLNSMNFLSEGIFLYLLSGGFLFTYFMLGARKHFRNIGFLIPASNLMALALYSDLQKIDFINNLGGGFFYLSLGISFLILLIHTVKFQNWDWPIYPAGSLIIFGVLVIFVEQSSFIENYRYLAYFIPILLIILGAFLLYKNQKQY